MTFLPLSLTTAALLGLLGPLAVRTQSPTLNDAQIAHIAVTANQLDVMAARQALEKSTNAQVRSFAETMIRDHEGVIQKATALAGRLGVTPEDNETSHGLAASAKATRERLAGLSGAAFDEAFMANEVAYHEAVIEAVEGTLVPNTQNVELKQLLESVLPALRAHLAHAKRVAAELG